jgi:hypothetical protein
MAALRSALAVLRLRSTRRLHFLDVPIPVPQLMPPCTTGVRLRFLRERFAFIRLADPTTICP